MSRLFAADVEPALTHPFEDIAVPHLGPFQRQPLDGEAALQPQIRHDRRDNAATSQQAGGVPAQPQRRHDLVAIDDRAMFVDDDQPVGVAIERDADIGTAGNDRFLQQLRMGRPAGVIDILAVGLDTDGDHFRPQFPQCGRRGVVGRAIGTIDDDLEPV